MNLEAMSIESVVSGGIGGVGFSLLTGKLLISSVMSHIETLKKQNADCEVRYGILRQEFTALQSRFMTYLGEKNV